MITSPILLATFVAGLAVRFYILWFRRQKLKKHMPPSPPGVPFLGNSLQVPHTEPWHVFTRWGEQYGAVYSLDLAGKHLVMLNTLEAATDLLDRRSTSYSDRPRMIMAGEILSDGLNMAFTRYGDLWRKMRRASHDSLHIRAIAAYRPQQEWDAALLIEHMLEEPDSWDQHFRLASASIALYAAYGHNLMDKRSFSIVERINEITSKLSFAAAPANSSWVELFPSLLYLPDWLATWKREGRKELHRFSATFLEFIDDIREKMKAGSAPKSLATALIENEGKHGLSKEQAAWLAGAVFSAGSETTSGSLIVFLLAMVLYPEVLKRAQDEVDTVVGQDRMPNLDDQDNLPYINAILKEVLRWRPVAPLGLARRCVQDDWYDGRLIPQGATVISNIWAISQDPRHFPNPDEFIPERYLGETDLLNEAMKPETHFAFGFGRRICPGRNLAYQSLYIFIASMIWALDIRKAKDSEGNEITPSRTACVNEGTVVRPVLFKCEISPRHPDVAGIVGEVNRRFSGL